MRKNILSRIIVISVIIAITMIPYVNAKVESIQVENGQYIDAIRVTTNGTYNYDYANEVLRLVNEERAKENLAPLAMDRSTQNVAMLRSNECSIYYDHMRPNGLDFFTLEGDIFICGENIAIGYSTPEAVMDGWMNSPGHRANIMSSYATSIGIGCYESEGGLYWTQTFSSDSPAEVATTTGTQSVTQTHVVSATLNLLDLYIRGLGAANNLNVGETLVPTSIKNINVGWGYYSITILPSDVDFTSSNEEVFKVDSNGIVTAVGPGNATLTAALGDSILTYDIIVSAPLKSISLSDTNIDVYTGRTANLSVIYDPINTTDDKTVIWYSSDNNIATVDNNGVVTGVNVGTATIKAVVGDMSATATVNVNAAIESISLEEVKITAYINQVLDALKINYIPANATDDRTITWSSSNSDVASIALDGVITTKSLGTTIITATSKNGKTATCELEVVDYIKGDLNLDGKINSQDASMILDKYKYENATAEDIKIGDMNNDGKLNATDASQILDIYKNSN